MSWRRWLGMMAAGLVLAAIPYALRPTDASDTAYWLSYLVLFLTPVALIWVLRGRIIHVVKTGELGMIERNGRFIEVAQPGLTLLCPFFETLRVLPTSEQTHSCAEENVLTVDGVSIGIKMVVRYRLQAATRQVALRAGYQVSDWQGAVRSQAAAALHQQVGLLTIDEVVKKWTLLGERVSAATQVAAATWGVTIVATELHSVRIPDSLRVALEDSQTAEIDAKAAEYRAGGEVERIRQILEVLGEAGLDAALTERYIQALETMSANPSSHIILPVDVLHGLRRLGGGASPETAADGESTGNPVSSHSSQQEGPASGAPSEGETSRAS